MRFVLCVATSCAGLLFAKTGAVQQFNTGNLPNSFGLAGITSGSDGALWFAGTGGTSIGRIEKAVGCASPRALSSARGIFMPRRIHQPWALTAISGFRCLGAAERRLATTTVGVVTTFIIDQSGAESPGQITAGPDGALWLTDATGIGRISTSGVFTHFGLSSPTIGIAAGPDGNMWLTTAGSVGHITTGMTGLALLFDHFRWQSVPQISRAPPVVEHCGSPDRKARSAKSPRQGVIHHHHFHYGSDARARADHALARRCDSVQRGKRDRLAHRCGRGRLNCFQRHGERDYSGVGWRHLVHRSAGCRPDLAKAGIRRIATGSSNSGAPTVSQITPSSIVVTAHKRCSRFSAPICSGSQKARRAPIQRNLSLSAEP